VGIVCSKLQKDLIVKSIRMGQTDVLRDGLTLTAGDNAHLEIVPAPEGGQIEGSVVDKDDNPVAGATVVAVPEPGLRPRRDRFYQASADQYGRYQVKNATPGDYKIFAWDNIEPGAWFDADFLRDAEANGEAVKLEAKGHETAKVHVQ
jgi:hypothetical protein